MQPTARLSGRILDDRGRGLPGASIMLVASQPRAIDTFPRVAYARSDSDGTYRMTAAPGDYIVHAYADTPVRQSRGVSLAYLSTFYPGVRSSNEAQVIRLAPGVEQYDVDFALLSSRTVRVSGTVSDPSGTDLEDVIVRLDPQGPFGPRNVAVQLRLNARGEFDSDDFVAQVERALQNVVAVIRTAGAGPEHLARMTWYVTDKREYVARSREIGDVYRRVIARHYPAMTLVVVAGLLEDRALVEIEATAVVSD